MKGFKQLFAIIFVLAVVTFGVLVTIDERELFAGLNQLGFKTWDAAKISLLYLMLIVVDVLLIALPTIGFFLILSGKYDPFKAIANCALIVLAKFLVSIIVIILVFVASGYQIDWNQLFFGKDSMLIIPTVVFGLAIILVGIAKSSNYEGKVARAILTTIGSGLAIFGLCYYFIGGGTSGFLGGGDANWLSIMGLVVGISCFGGLILYSFLPQTREF